MCIVLSLCLKLSQLTVWQILLWTIASQVASAHVLFDSFDVNRPTVVPDPLFNLSRSTRTLRHAMEGYGTNENQVISILTTIDFHQRKLVEGNYKRLFKRNLVTDLKNELSGSLEKFVLALIQEPDELLAQDLYYAMKGFGTDEETLTEILGCQDSDNIQQISTAYQSMYRKSLESVVHSETSGKLPNKMYVILDAPHKLVDCLMNDSRCKTLRRYCLHRDGVIVSSLSATNNRHKIYKFIIHFKRHRGVTVGTPEKFAQALVRPGFGRSGKMSESLLINLLTNCTFKELTAGLTKLRGTLGLRPDESLHHGYSGDFGRAVTTIVECAENRPRLYATRLHGAFGRFRNDDRTLIRIAVLRAPIDLDAIKTEYKKLYKDTLKNAVSKSVKGDLRHGILALLGQ